MTCRGDADKRLAKLVEAGAVALSLDVTASQETIQQAVQQALDRCGRIDVLVNNAGGLVCLLQRLLADLIRRYRIQATFCKAPAKS